MERPPKYNRIQHSNCPANDLEKKQWKESSIVGPAIEPAAFKILNYTYDVSGRVPKTITNSIVIWTAESIHFPPF